MRTKSWKPVFSPCSCAKRLASSWLLLHVIWLGIGVSAPGDMPLPLFLGGWLLGFALLSALFLLRPSSRLENGLLLGSAAAYAWLLVYQYAGDKPYAFCAALLLALGLLLCSLYRQPGALSCRVSGRRLCLIAVSLCGLFFVAVVGGITCLRYATYSAPNYDFGIFSQMFYSMKTSLLPLVTCERDQLLSHFAVHISPVFYLLLPAYAVFPSPYTLQIGQAVVLASGLLPLYLLGKKFGLSYGSIALLSLIYAGYPALNAGCFYDIHENCFLTPALLWLFVCYEYRRYGWMYAAAAGVLLIKEDAAVYLVVFGAYLWLTCKERHGKWLILLAVCYFLVAIAMLSCFGEGAMFGRYANLSAADPSLSGVLLTLLRNPGHFFDQLFRASDGSSPKWLYLFQLLAPLAGLPWITRKTGRYLLLAPLLLNLLTTYIYQYDIGFQYSFGIGAFFFYLVGMNLPDLSAFLRRKLLLLSVLSTCLLFTVAVLPRLESQVAYYRSHQAAFAQMDRALATIPQDASVTASCMLVAHLSARDEVYELAYHEGMDTDYVVFDMRPGYQEEAEPYRKAYAQAGYHLEEAHEDLLEIWSRA